MPVQIALAKSMSAEPFAFRWLSVVVVSIAVPNSFTDATLSQALS